MRQTKSVIYAGMGRGQVNDVYRVIHYIKPKNTIERNHNKEALVILEMKRSQIILDGQAINSDYIT